MGLFEEAFIEFQKAFTMDSEFTEAKKEMDSIFGLVCQLKEHLENNVHFFEIFVNF